MIGGYEIIVLKKDEKFKQIYPALKYLMEKNGVKSAGPITSCTLSAKAGDLPTLELSIVINCFN